MNDCCWEVIEFKPATPATPVRVKSEWRRTAPPWRLGIMRFSLACNGLPFTISYPSADNCWIYKRLRSKVDNGHQGKKNETVALNTKGIKFSVVMAMKK